eukprot:CAMPEP_0202755952 /NCGR_PEP_ID=MMETSP1388-20130828/15358_1 /ASSEMBLY_ACC=CAM_ASM_000864 /TAXON_ID=37098 /ORGANISM="Isochrysis sp, Strain CCMP1244" /LENGTH=106 /DNA_ID=CAMNT_0049423791 /DNA_START=61 /DNA_END=379 /DNA_ORIENTATION=-
MTLGAAAVRGEARVCEAVKGGAASAGALAIKAAFGSGECGGRDAWEKARLGLQGARESRQSLLSLVDQAHSPTTERLAVARPPRLQSIGEAADGAQVAAGGGGGGG